MATFIHATSDFLILVGMFYTSLLIVKLFTKQFIPQLVIATIVVNIGAPFVARHFETPMYKLVERMGWMYFWPISIFAGLVFISAFLFERSGVKNIK